ncbi:MAG: hypothetical protein OER87_05045, partial [Gammaproteobacteria bacterium]|nr:hypothetical protein [Gammaproteobacteria bacterium]
MNPRLQTLEIDRPSTTTSAGMPTGSDRFSPNQAFVFAGLLMLAMILAPIAQAQDNSETRYKR